MGKHLVKSGTGRDRSRGRRTPEAIMISKYYRRPRARLNARIKDFEEKNQYPGYNRPGSLKARTN